MPLWPLLLVLWVPPMIVPNATPSATPTATAVSATATPASCPGDLNNDGAVTVDEVIRAIRGLLDGCP